MASGEGVPAKFVYTEVPNHNLVYSLNNANSVRNGQTTAIFKAGFKKIQN
ncbi:hypothetical protein [Bacillus sp. V59.32b]|nr:hypothetical protein [Bacillus sp. V59.32b]